MLVCTESSSIHSYVFNAISHMVKWYQCISIEGMPSTFIFIFESQAKISFEFYLFISCAW